MSAVEVGCSRNGGEAVSGESACAFLSTASTGREAAIAGVLVPLLVAFECPEAYVGHRDSRPDSRMMGVFYVLDLLVAMGGGQALVAVLTLLKRRSMGGIGLV